jgi:hypothetical protein
MPTPFESAQLNLQLFELRREPLLRQARAWFIAEFHPETFDEARKLTSGEQNAWFRMVVSYWDMAASLVTSGAIDADAFLAANGEIVAAFSKIQPILSDIRTALGEPTYCKHMETVVLSLPDAEATLKRRRETLKALTRAQPSQV